MKHKKILLNSFVYGNMEALFDYYNKNLKDKNSNIVVNYVDHYKLYNTNKILHYLYRIKEYFGGYDVIVSDYPTKLLSRCKKSVYMSHGYGTKKSPGNDEVKDEDKMNNYRIIRRYADYLITLSDFDSKYFLKSEHLKYEPIPDYIPLGLPRNDSLFDKDFINSSKKNIAEKFKTGESKLILFAPTWRGYKIDKKFPFSREDLIILNDFLESKNWKILYRPHYVESIVSHEMLLNLNNIVLADFKNEPDTKKILAAVDLLITDYSSIFIDYLSLKKPMVFIPFDVEQYKTYRGLVIDYNNDIDTPGPKITNIEELKGYINNIDHNNDDYEEFRNKAIEKYYKYFDGDSCKRIWSFIVDLIK